MGDYDMFPKGKTSFMMEVKTKKKVVALVWDMINCIPSSYHWWICHSILLFIEINISFKMKRISYSSSHILNGSFFKSFFKSPIYWLSLFYNFKLLLFANKSLGFAVYMCLHLLPPPLSQHKPSIFYYAKFLIEFLNIIFM